MFDAEPICPYTGLRSFTEEESLYFKGREEDIDQATAQLQRNKFLMLTGASGDGKSSLIYAGIIPNARAGFLKAKYTQWCVADFRPERAPFRNLCRAIANQLDITNLDTVQAELNHGFSAIIDLYKNSKRYIDTGAADWIGADEAGKSAMKREAANLLILVDQFEEFFTNPENYHRGVPSTAANLVLNLLLETAQIALDEDLPVYIVFTMRSDYIGQCAAFRGLPEYIGFSQFFVPRLNRTQLQQVIEEPAVLSGNRITRRLTERLIHDLTEGVDQLPILQHALNQIWHAAGNGSEEMDLLHYAMVGGMPDSELPDEQLDRFRKWFDELPDHIRACYHRPNLQNVLDTHTNKLFEQAADYYTKHTGKEITDTDAKSIIKTAFICLTKIDQSRAVRNRMSLKEITDILGDPRFSTADVGAVLNIFREPGNTFIRPFIREDGGGRDLHEDTVLDITHESLIRNWAFLEQWAKEEFDDYTISLDFEQQLNRWVESGKSRGFLLPIGPLTYFENWFNRVRPNAHWIARYLPEEIAKETKLQKAQQVLSNAQEFLKRSAAKHVVTRTVMRYGPKRIAITLGLLAILILSSFAVRSYFRKQNGYVLDSIRESTFKIANQPKLSPEFPIPPLTEQLMLGNTTIPDIISAIDDKGQKIKIATAIATQLMFQGRYEPRREIYQSLALADSLLEELRPADQTQTLSGSLKLLSDYGTTAGYAWFMNPSDSLHAFLISNAQRSARWVLQVLDEQPAGFSDIQFLSLSLQEAINQKAFSSEEIRKLLSILSPFENTNRNEWLLRNFDKDKILVRGSLNYGIRYNGLFQDLASLYAAAGEPAKVLQCMDSLLRYQESFYQNDYATHIENASNIAAVFYTYNKTDFLDAFVQGYCSRKGIGPVEFYNRLVSWAMFEPFQMSNANFYAGGGGQTFSNNNLVHSSDGMMTFFFDKLLESIDRISNANDRNFNRAVILKNEGILFAYRDGIRGIQQHDYKKLFAEAVAAYQNVAKSYLEENISVIGSSGADLVTVPRKFLFLFPDYRVPFHPFEPRSIIQFWYTPAFVQYVLGQGLFDTLYESTADLREFQLWFSDYQIVISVPALFVREPMPESTMSQLASQLEARQADQYYDLNILYLHLGLTAFHQNEPENAIRYLEHIQPEKLLNAFQYKNFTFVNNYSLEVVGEAMAALSVHNRFDLAFKLLDVFKKEVNRSSLYGFAAQQILLQNGSRDIAMRLIDSARVEMERLANPDVFQPNRHQLAMALMYADPDHNEAEAYRIIKNSPNKFQAMFRFSRAFARRENLYKAEQQMPSLISTADRTGFYKNILQGYNEKRPPKDGWARFVENEPIFFRLFLPYINENQ